MLTHKLTKLRETLFFLVFVSCSSCYAAGNVDSVSFRGDCTILGMKVEGAYFSQGAFLVTTTGARFEYTPGSLKIYQGLVNDIDRRLVATILIKDVNEFEKVESNDDHVLLWSEKLNIGIYGDSTCILAPKTRLDIAFTGNFKPDYEGRDDGELLLIDDLGGLEIYPQKNEMGSGYATGSIKLGKKDWTAEYQLDANERTMIAAFPGRPFDWDKSFKSNIVFTCGSMGEPYGVMPPDSFFEQWSNIFNIVSIWHDGLYNKFNTQDTFSGPYLVVKSSQAERAVNAIHKHGMKAIFYCSFFYHHKKYQNPEQFFREITNLKYQFSIDGVYIDGIIFPFHKGESSDRFANWEMIRRLRQLFGSNGILVMHNTSLGNPAGTAPNIDAYCDATLNGEGVSFKSLDDPYINYQVKKYNISNTVALWKPGPHPLTITQFDIIDKLISMNGRERYWAGTTALAPSAKNPNIWIDSLDRPYRYYLDKLQKEKNRYEEKRNP